MNLENPKLLKSIDRRITMSMELQLLHYDKADQVIRLLESIDRKFVELKRIELETDAAQEVAHLKNQITQLKTELLNLSGGPRDE